MRSTRPSPQSTQPSRFLRLVAPLGTMLALMLGLSGLAVLPASGLGDDVDAPVHDAAEVVTEEEESEVVTGDAASHVITDDAASDNLSEEEEPDVTEDAASDDVSEERDDDVQPDDVDVAPAATSDLAVVAPAHTDAPMTQAADARTYSPYVHVAESVSEWDLARTGIELFAGGFAGSSSVVALVDGAPFGELSTDEHGFAEHLLVGELAPGTYTLVLTADEGTTPERSFTVVADDEYYDPGLLSPQLAASSWVVTVAELDVTPITVRGTGYPANAPVDLLINGARQEAIHADTSGVVELEVSAPLDAGEYTVTLSHPTGTASVTFHVIPDEPGDAAPAGPYAGQSLQDRAGGQPFDEAAAHPVQFHIGADGQLSGFQTEFWWVCAVGGYQGSGYDIFEGMPPSLITVGRPFEVSWEGTTMSYVLTGVVHADGTATGRGVAYQGVCGAHAFSWTAQFDGELPGPVDPAPPAQIPAETPRADELSDAAQGRVTVPATAPAGATVPVVVGTEHAADDVGVWLFSEPLHLVTATVSADGTIMASLPGDVVGEHRIAAYAADGSLIGWDVIAIISEEPGDPGDDHRPGTPGDDDRPGTPGDGDGPGTPGTDGAGQPGPEAAPATGESTSTLPSTGAPLGGAALTGVLLAAAGVLVRRARIST